MWLLLWLVTWLRRYHRQLRRAARLGARLEHCHRLQLAGAEAASIAILQISLMKTRVVAVVVVRLVNAARAAMTMTSSLSLQN